MLKGHICIYIGNAGLCWLSGIVPSGQLNFHTLSFYKVSWPITSGNVRLQAFLSLYSQLESLCICWKMCPILWATAKGWHKIDALGFSLWAVLLNFSSVCQVQITSFRHPQDLRNRTKYTCVYIQCFILIMT